MTVDELAEFLALAPTGAICADVDGRLLALPARVASFDSARIGVTVTGMIGDVVARSEVNACVAADTFTAYRDIRGVIAQGAISWPPRRDDVAALNVERTTTFSFVNS
jgi:hypothetical protein